MASEWTTRCVACLDEPAIFWQGYVLRGAGRGKDKPVVAGWCKSCFGQHCGTDQCFVGWYVTAMGRRTRKEAVK